MRWFDDLWLKEGFAQYMAYRAMDALHPETDPWKHFFEDIKPQAYGIDETEGTTPIFQDIPNLKDAKSAYGAIVYQKAPAILKQLEFRLGPAAFQRGLQLYLAQHSYGNAEWSDLVAALHAASGQDVKSWADAWVLRRGMPEVTAAFTCHEGQLTTLSLHQHDVLPDNFVWPITTDVLRRGGQCQRLSQSSHAARNTRQGRCLHSGTAEYSVPIVHLRECRRQRLWALPARFAIRCLPRLPRQDRCTRCSSDSDSRALLALATPYCALGKRPQGRLRTQPLRTTRAHRSRPRGRRVHQPHPWRSSCHCISRLHFS